jgi:ubiquinone/menaquinone biosynthesis C-methylase UbiE
MTAHDQVYQNEAPSYEWMISKQPDLTEYINEIRPIHGLNVLDMGAGSGRFAAQIAKQAKSLVCTDISEAMLGLLDIKLEDQGLHRNWTTLVADHREIPIEDSSIDLVVSGWSVCYLVHAGNEKWEANLEQVIGEMKRVLRPGGTIILFETLGTGTETPNPPDFLQPYYDALINKYGFSHRWVRADYSFANVDEARKSTEFFFGEDLAARITKNNWATVPECAGIWWLQV